MHLGLGLEMKEAPVSQLHISVPSKWFSSCYFKREKLHNVALRCCVDFLVNKVTFTFIASLHNAILEDNNMLDAFLFVLLATLISKNITSLIVYIHVCTQAVFFCIQQYSQSTIYQWNSVKPWGRCVLIQTKQGLAWKPFFHGATGGEQTPQGTSNLAIEFDIMKSRRT